MRILLVEDEQSLREAIQLNLSLEGYDVITVSNGYDALETHSGQHFDLILLDIMLPGIDGFEVCQRVRLSDANTPIIFLTAKDTPEDRIRGLRIGADDYMQKPFHLEELLLRIQNVLKRAHPEMGEALEVFEFGTFWIDFKNFKALSNQGVINLTQKETQLLKLLISKRNITVSRKEILQSVWGYEVFPSTRTIDNFVLSFRKYFEKNPREPIYFKSVRGVGYRFEHEDPD